MESRRFLRVSGAIALSVLADLAVLAAAPSSPAIGAYFPYMVRVSVSSPRNKDAIESLLSRGLRSLPGVRLADGMTPDLPDHELSVVEVEEAGLHAMSATIVEFVSPLTVAMACELGETGHVTPPDSKETAIKATQLGYGALKLMENVGTVRLHRVVTGADLTDLCQRIVASFDSQVLEPVRNRIKSQK